MNAQKPLSPEQIETLAKEIHAFLVYHGLWMDVSIYFNGKRWSTMKKDGDRWEFCYNETAILNPLQTQMIILNMSENLTFYP